MSIGAATVRNSMAFPRKIKIELVDHTATALLVLCEENENINSKTCMQSYLQYPRYRHNLSVL